MLGHYENECTFHTMECWRCGDGILYRDLPTHYIAGCSAAVTSARAENRSSESIALKLQQVSAAVEELKAVVRGLQPRPDATWYGGPGASTCGTGQGPGIAGWSRSLARSLMQRPRFPPRCRNVGPLVEIWPRKPPRRLLCPALRQR
ncbi:hypothetical protein MTO96_035873 [Rhipicephalus appendiculatus]